MRIFLKAVFAIAIPFGVATADDQTLKSLEDYDHITCYTDEDCRDLARHFNVEYKILCDYNKCGLIILETESNYETNTNRKIPKSQRN